MKKNEQGYAMLLTIFAIVFISVIGIGLLTVSSNSLKTSEHERVDQSVYYIAEGGLNFVERLVHHKIHAAYEMAKSDPLTFDSSFNTQLSMILSSERHTTLTEDYFKTTINGKPTAVVTIEYEPSTPRKFTIISEGSLSQHKKPRTVTRNYSILDDLLTIETIETMDTSETLPPSEIQVEDYSKIKANNYISDRLFLDWTPKSNMNAHFYAGFNHTINLFKLRVYPSEVKNNVTFNYKQPAIPKSTQSFSSIPKTSKGNAVLTNTATIQTITKDYAMPKLKNFSNSEFNLHVDKGEHDLTFEDSFLNYNLASVVFNISGSGTLNIVFDKYFELNVGRKFIINAPNAKVNLIFKKSATIRGELLAQNIFLQDGRLEPTITSKLVANDVYIEKGNFDKDFNASVQVNDVYIKKGNLTVSGSKEFTANSITVKEGNVRVASFGKLNAKEIYVEDGELNSLATSCLQADTIAVPKGDVRIDAKGNYKNLYADTLYTIISSEINQSSCKKSNVTITPSLPEIEQTTKTETIYQFKDDTLIHADYLTEVQ